MKKTLLTHQLPTIHRFGRWRKRIVFLLLVVVVPSIILGGLGVAFLLVRQSQELRGRASSTGTVLTMNPTALSVKVGETVTVHQTINTGTDIVSAAEIHTTYPPQLFQVQTVVAGPFLPVVLIPGTFKDGETSIILGAQPTAPKKGAGVISSITLKATQPGTATISFANTTQVAALDKTANAATLGDEIQITITPGEEPKTTPSSEPKTTSQSQAVYKLVNQTGIILLTASEKDRNEAVEKYGFMSPKVVFRTWGSRVNPKLLPVVRLIKAGAGYLYTLNDTDKTNAIKSGWKEEGVAFYAYPEKNAEASIPVYKLKSTKRTVVPQYVFTASRSERTTLIRSKNYTGRGTAFYVTNQ